MKQSGLQEKHRSIVSLGLRKGDVGKLYGQVTLYNRKVCVRIPKTP